MRSFHSSMTQPDFFWEHPRTPNFDNFLKVLRRQKPDRPTLYELFLNEKTYARLAKENFKEKMDEIARLKIIIYAFYHAGYDYAAMYGSAMAFKNQRQAHEGTKTISINEGGVISDDSSLKAYHWPDPDSFDYSYLEKLKDLLPEGMKLVVMGPGGVLENVISLVGYEQLCFMVMDEPDLADTIFNEVGSRLVRYYEICASFSSVGALVSNDDRGFKGQTMMSATDMRRFVFPWHKKIAEVIHATGKPVLLHSCGDLSKVMDDVIDDMKYDAKHSFEDNILQVEDAYEQWGSRFAILGGIDVDFLCRSTPEAVFCSPGQAPC